ncbi:MAG: PEP-CTERM sorting domain-containing protein [Sedimenticola sp.]
MKLFKALVASAALIFSFTAYAGVIDPTTGASGNASWSSPVGTGYHLPVTSWLGMPGHEHTITVTTDSLIDIHIADRGVMGDAFAIELDSVIIAPTSGSFGADTRGPGATSFFDAMWEDVFLSAGTHTLGLFVTDACCTSGGTHISSVSAAEAVPEPSIIALLGAGLVGIGFTRRRAKK